MTRVTPERHMQWWRVCPGQGVERQVLPTPLKGTSEFAGGFPKIEVHLHRFCPEEPQSFFLLPMWRDRKTFHQPLQVSSLTLPLSAEKETVLQTLRARTVPCRIHSAHVLEDISFVVEDKTPEPCPRGFNSASHLNS